MFQVRIEHQYASRLYKAESLVDAMELFHLLSKTCKLVQVYGGDLDPICEYRLDWASKAEAHQHENPLCK